MCSGQPELQAALRLIKAAEKEVCTQHRPAVQYILIALQMLVHVAKYLTLKRRNRLRLCCYQCMVPRKYIKSNDVTVVTVWDHEHLYDIILGTMHSRERET